MKHRIERMYPVYAKGCVLGIKPLFFVTKKERNEMVSNGSAIHVAHNKAIQLTTNMPPTVQPSLSMGPSVIERACDGSVFHKLLVAAWAPCLA